MIRLKSLLLEGVESYKLSNGDWNYAKIESSKNATDIAELLKQSRGTFQDDEAVAEAAFMAMAKSGIYDKVKAALKQDPYTFVKSFISTGTVYHKQSIDASYKKMQTSKTTSPVTQVSADSAKTVSLGSELTPEFIQLVKNWENSKDYKPGGWKPELKKWYPHRSPEGGTDTIAYGHKLTADDINTGKFLKGITDQQAQKLMISDLEIAKRKAMKLVPSYSSLPTNVKQALINACYRGELSNSKTPNTLKLMRAGKWKAAAREYLDHDEYKKGGGVKTRMDWNAKQFATMR